MLLIILCHTKLFDYITSNTNFENMNKYAGPYFFYAAGVSQNDNAKRPIASM